MTKTALLPLAVALAGIVGAGLTAAAAAPARKGASRPAMVKAGRTPVGVQRPTTTTLLSIGEGQMVTLPTNVKDIWTSAPDVADVYVRSARQIYLFGKAFGEATVYATAADGSVIYSTNVRTSQNITSVDRMLKLAMPDANITISTVGQLAVMTGTVGSPQDAAEAEALVRSALNPGVDVSAPGASLKIQVVSRLKTSTPMQVNLQVKIAEVSRNFVKEIGTNLTNRDSGGFIFGLQQGRQGTIGVVPGTPPAGYIGGAPVDANGQPIALDANGAVPGTKLFQFPAKGANTLLGVAGRFLGMDLLASLDLGERNGQVTTLANPNLTALSGETSSFLAGGEIPIPVSQGLGAVSVEYKQYGVSLTYTPTVLSDGRISLRVRPEVSQLSAAGAVIIAGTQIPALTTRRAETTVELGSGQSMMIGGLLSNTHNNTYDKTPGAGDLPILGALFRSNAFQRNETELVIVVTPYLVKPVDANSIVLPTDGYKAPDDAARIFMGQLGGGTTGGDRPKPAIAPPVTAAPVLGAQGAPAPILPAPAPAQVSAGADAKATNRKPKQGAAIAMPGFSGN